MRCLTLADALKKHGHRCLFISRSHPGNLIAQVVLRGYQIAELPCSNDFKTLDTEAPAHAAWLGIDWQTDAEQTQVVLEGLDVDWLVVDHYALEQRWQQQLQPCYQKLMVIDDLADREHRCHLLLDQTYGRKAETYRSKVPASTELLTGAEYALLRPEFAEQRQASFARRGDSSLKRLLINLGGVDKDNITSRVLHALAQSSLPSDCAITVVMGATAPWIDRVTELACSISWQVDVKTNAANMAELMCESDLAIGAAGSTSWERCCLGLPTIMVVLADNQKTIAEQLQQAGAAMVIMELAQLDQKLPMMVKQLATQAQCLTAISQQARQVTDGAGVLRVVERMEAMHD